LDRKSLIWPGLNAFASQSFESFDQLSLSSHSILVVSRITIVEHREAILELANTNPHCVVVFDGAAEGSLTLMEQIKSYDLETDDNKRLVMIADVLKQLDGMSVQQRQDLYTAAIPIVQHNYNHFYNGAFESILWTELTGMLDSIVKDFND
jgi:hypothetical protein